MNKEKFDKIIPNPAFEKEVIHNSSQKRLPYESIKWVNGGWVVKMWKENLPIVPPLPINEKIDLLFSHMTSGKKSFSLNYKVNNGSIHHRSSRYRQRPLRSFLRFQRFCNRIHFKKAQIFKCVWQ